MATKKYWLEQAIHPVDCLVGMATMPPASVHLGVTDPPFNIGLDYDVHHDRQPPKIYLDWASQWIAEMYRVLTSDGSFWMAIGDEYVSELDVLAKARGFIKRSHVIWYYTFGVNCTRSFTRSHTHLLHYIKDRKRFTFNEKEVRIPSARQSTYSDGRANPAGRLPDNTWVLRPQETPELFMSGEDVWHCSRVCGTYKAKEKWMVTQMPEQVIGRIIRLCSLEGDIVFDPFVGSGTTIAVAKKLGRRHLGFELSTNYAKKALERVQAVKAGDPLDNPDIQGGQ